MVYRSACWLERQSYAPSELMKLATCSLSERVEVLVAEDGIFYGDEKRRVSMGIQLRTLLEAAKEDHWLRGMTGVYAAQIPMFFKGSFVPRFLPKGGRERAWICAGAARTPLHFDDFHNALTVLHGRKQVRYCRYSRVPPRPAWSVDANHPNDDSWTPSTTKVILNPYDVLFLPAGWWHQVDSDPSTVAVNYWWFRTTTVFTGEPRYHDRRILVRQLHRSVRSRLRRSTSLPEALRQAATASDPSSRRTAATQFLASSSVQRSDDISPPLAAALWLMPLVHGSASWLSNTSSSSSSSSSAEDPDFFRRLRRARDIFFRQSFAIVMKRRRRAQRPS